MPESWPGIFTTNAGLVSSSAIRPLSAQKGSLGIFFLKKQKQKTVIQDAPHEFRSLVDSLQSVKIAMHDLEEEVKNENSALSRAGEDRVRNVVAMVGALMRTLKAVEKIVNRYQVIVGPATDLKSYSVKLWGKIKWVQEVKAIEDLKQKLMFHTGAITLVLLTVGKYVMEGGFFFNSRETEN